MTIATRRTRVLFFTAGTVGAGHFVRGLALERAIARLEPAGRGIELLSLGPPLPELVAALGMSPRYRAVKLDALELLDGARAPQSELAAAIADFDPDVLVVDLFWAPLARLLPLARGEAWLLVRRVPPRWFVGPPGVPFDKRLFSRVIAIEPGVEHAPIDETIAPIVIANHDETRPRGALREALGVAPGERLVVAAQAGQPGEREAITRAVPPELGRVHTLAPSRDLFPLCAWLGDADAFYTGAGYNAFWEARWLGYADRTTFVPFSRGIDDQAWRVRACSAVTPSENGADVLARQLPVQ